MEARLKVYEENTCKEMKSLFKHFLGSSLIAVAKKKEVMRAPPPGFAPREPLELPPPFIATS